MGPKCAKFFLALPSMIFHGLKLESFYALLTTPVYSCQEPVVA